MDRRNLNIAISTLGEFVGQAREEFAALRRGDLNSALMAWDATGDDYDELDALRKELNALLEDMSRVTIPEMFSETAGRTKTISLAEVGKRFTVAQRVNCSMPDKEKGIFWLRENGHGALVTEVVNAQTLSAFAKRLVQDEGKELPEDIFKLSTMNYTSATKIK